EFSGTLEAPVHSMKRFYKIPDNAERRIQGGGTKLYFNWGLKDSGYSGNPLSFVPYRPLNSPHTYIYIGDYSKMSKMDVDGNVFNMGIAPPILPLTAAIGSP